MVHLRLDEKMRKEIRKAVDENLFSNETEFIRDSIRRNIELYKKIQIIHSLRGSVKKIKNSFENSYFRCLQSGRT